MAATFFKVWSLKGHKGVIYLTQKENMLLNLIVKASEKFDMDGAKIVLQKDGTDIDEDIILEHFKDEVLLLLEPGQIWNGTGGSTSGSTSLPSTSMASTITLIDNGIECSDIIASAIPSDSSSSETISQGEEIQGSSTFTFTIDCNSNMLWKLFDFPWEILPKNIYDACEQGKRLDHQAKTFVIQTIVNKMREIKDQIPANAIHIVAQKILEKFPLMFRDVDEDGVIIGDGSHTLFRKIQDRNNYLNRQQRRPTQDSAIKNKKRRVAEKAGCTSWNPIVEEECELKPQLDRTDPQLKEKIEKYFSQQRNFIISNPTVNDINETWPILLTKEGSFCHFQKLTSANPSAILTMAEKYDKFEKLAALSNFSMDKSKPKVLQIFLLITKQLNESPLTFYKEMEGNNIDDLLDKIDQMHPIIVKLADCHQYFLIFEKSKIYEDVNFDDVFGMAFCLYFNFNLKYPPSASLTFDFIQRYIFKIHPDSGSKISKCNNMKQGSKSRVFTLMKKLRDF